MKPQIVAIVNVYAGGERGKGVPEANTQWVNIKPPVQLSFNASLDDGTASGGEGGTSCRGVVPAHRIHRDQSGDAEPGGSTVL
jgi:hypothetical protein